MVERITTSNVVEEEKKEDSNSLEAILAQLRAYEPGAASKELAGKVKAFENKADEM